MNKNFYNKNYYSSNNYKNYLKRYEKYKKLSDDIEKILYSLNFYNKNCKILDYGCAVGFLLDALKEKKYSNLFGFDISEFCKNIFENNHKSIDILEKQEFDFILFLDVLEHMTDDEITNVLNILDSKYILVRIPCARDFEENFFLEVSRNDPTHINCKTKNKWKDLFNKLNYKFYCPLNYENIYDSDGVFCAIFKKGE
jgi:SAM-dependent methyltransferase